MSSGTAPPSSSVRTRPVKRRRIEVAEDDESTASQSKSSDRGLSSFIDDEAEEGSTSESDPDLPPSAERNDSESPEPKPRYKYYEPKNVKNVPEDVFVTQLTQQQHSSPSRLRGPRWKKPDQLQPKQSQDFFAAFRTQQAQRVQSPSNAVDESEDEDIRAALAESLKFAQPSAPTIHNTPRAATRREPQQTSSKRKAAASRTQVGAEDDTDEFGSDPFEAAELDEVVEAAAAGNSRNRSFDTQTNFRQTTLFGAVQEQQPSTQRRGHTWPLANRDEPPTHHILDREALKTWVYPTNLGRIRDYQYNIVGCSLYHNTLVALPTGLGKTFIAATVMLNWYRWTRDAQIVFVAPTKPLVSQQVGACFGIAGIPRSDTTLLTGNVSPGLRAQEWLDKRVFFMTPQTLINDLKTGIADPKRIILIVVDEAHRATGNYAYVEVVTFLRRFNQSFRVLALTATPGPSVESVQAVIDGLEISRVEIRTEFSMDIRDYVHDRNIEIELFDNSEEMEMTMDLFSAALKPLLSRLNGQNAFWGKDPLALTAYGLTKARQAWMASAGRNANMGVKGMVNSLFTALSSLAHAIELLKFHGIGPFYRNVRELKSGSIEGQGAKNKKEVAANENFKKMMNRLETWMDNPDFIGHPKLEYLSRVVLNHFMDSPDAASTRIMIFCHFRDSADEVVRVLKRHEMIKPHVFVGQAASKGLEGMDQKTQLSVIDKFKKGEYNTIVATSIGEEGLDIGEVDLIVCYDSSASPIRMLQRMGRTGRKRAGNIVLLLMRGKEEQNYAKAKDNYEAMQKMIAKGDRFEYHHDKSMRIVPRDIDPQVDKRQVEIPPENSQADLPEPKKKGRAPKRPPKKFHMPDGVDTSFTTAGLLAGGSRRKKAKQRTPSPEPERIPPPEECFLTTQEEAELEHRYLNIPGNDAEYVRAPNMGAFPELQRRPASTCLVPHSTRTKAYVKAMASMHSISLRSDYAARPKLRIQEQDLPSPPGTQEADFFASQETVRPPEKTSISINGKSATSTRETLLESDDGGSPVRLSQLMKGPKRSAPRPLATIDDFPTSSQESELPDIHTLATRKIPKKRIVFDSDDDDLDLC